jgi:rare lipoprotein A
MCIRRALSLALIVSAGLAASAYSASAQSFEERWSVVPKANAEEPAQPQTQDSGVLPQPPIDGSVGFKERTSASSSPQTRTLRRLTRSGRAGSTKVFTGKASFIAYSGGKTASGAPYRPQGLTAAHRTLPFGTRLKVTDLKTRRQVQVVVTDRGPFVRGRVLDLSRGAAQALGMEGRGVIQVRTEVLSENGGRTLARGS